MKLQKRIASQRRRRRYRVRNKIRKSGRLRLSVFRSNKHMYAQIIDDSQGHTLVAASTAEKDVAGTGNYGGNKEAASKVGKILAERAREAGIQEVALDRGDYRYHGRLAALADAVREGGLKF